MAVITGTSSTSNRAARSFKIRLDIANRDLSILEPRQDDNGDEARYADKSGTYTKGILQAGIGIVDPMAYQTFKKALSTGNPADFAAIKLGGTKTLNDPQGGLSFNLDTLDNAQFTVPPAPPVASDEYATELVEMYWASLLRDVPFTDYPDNQIAKDAAANLSSLQRYKGPRDNNGQVTPQLLFRGGSADGKTFFGQNFGPYISQFLIKETTLGGDGDEPSGLPLVQKFRTFEAHHDFMLDPIKFQKVQNGLDTGDTLKVIDPLFLHDGRGLAALTHKDVLYQEFLVAYLVLNSLKAPSNPGNPYFPGSPTVPKTQTAKTQNGFNTFGGPDISAIIAYVARQALNAVWYQKWFIHLRHRPESGGALVYAKKSQNDTNPPPLPQAAGDLNFSILDQAVNASFAKNKSYLLSQPFPEGSPIHPAYPTGHGTAAGACITVLKFFFDGDFRWIDLPGLKKSNIFPIEYSRNGSNLLEYKGSDADKLTINGELHKLAHNVTFGHGIHGGIHWRSDSDTSIQIGEAVALSFLNHLAHTYNEKFTVHLKKVDGSTATISN